LSIAIIMMKYLAWQAAVQLVNTLLQSNPFAAKLQTEELEQKLAEEREKLKAMDPPELEEPLTLWTNIQPKVTVNLIENIKKDSG
jgi:hypothetical protein